jgi:hypothetical protein
VTDSLKKRILPNPLTTARSKAELRAKMAVKYDTLSEYFAQGEQLTPVHQGQSIGS